MERRSYRFYLLLASLLLMLMSFPAKTQERLRGAAIAASAPLWEGVLQIKCLTKTLAAFLYAAGRDGAGGAAFGLKEEEIHQLQLENLRLQAQLQLLQEQIVQEWTVQNELIRALDLGSSTYEGKAFFQRRYEELCRVIDAHLDAYQARVIFRDPASWSSSLWVNVGQRDNTLLGRKVVCRNSPVIVGLNVVGVIDYVGERQSRVRLITDAGLTPSVRACRGFSQDMALRDKLMGLARGMALPQELGGGNPATQTLISQLLKSLPQVPASGYFAKGEVSGSSHPLWRARSDLLKGVGFNMDFPDEEGPARDLRTGLTQDDSVGDAATLLLKTHDLLVTTGMDGVFPAGLHVAEVIQVAPLKEGSYTFELSAKPCIKNLDDLSTVFILPPVGFSEDDRPLF